MMVNSRLDIGTVPAPAETTLRFRHRLETHNLRRLMLESMRVPLEARTINIQTGTASTRPFSLLLLGPRIREGSAIPRCTSRGMLRVTNQIYTLPKGYYAIGSIFLLLALTFLACISSMEQLLLRQISTSVDGLNWSSKSLYSEKCLVDQGRFRDAIGRTGKSE